MSHKLTVAKLGWVASGTIWSDLINKKAERLLHLPACANETMKRLI